MIKTLLFLFLMYLLIKIISRKFLSSGSATGSKKGNARSFYNTFRQFQQNQQQQRQQSQNKQHSSRFEEIEEAEFEDVTEEDNSAKSSD